VRSRCVTAHKSKVAARAGRVRNWSRRPSLSWPS
jgi:hypothetical protein